MDKLTPEFLLSDEMRERTSKQLQQIPGIVYQRSNDTAAVLIPLCVVDGEVHILYTLRSKTLKRHGGQISFPGGITDKGETARQTALRESEEELGLLRDCIDVWAEMSPVQGTRQATIITPVVGVIKQYNPVLLNPNINEVEEVFTVPLKHLCNCDNHGFVNMTYKNKKIPLPLYTYKSHIIWGVTALITHLFLINFLPEDVYEVSMKRKFEIDALLKSNL